MDVLYEKAQIIVIEIRYKVIPKVHFEFNFDDHHGELLVNNGNDIPKLWQSMKEQVSG